MDSEPMCRACLSESGDAVPIFSSAETSGVQMPLSDMMMACSSVQVMSGDGLPGLICLECLRSLLIAFEFKLKCEKTDAMLREYIENNLVPMQVGTTVYNKSVTVDSNTLVSVGQTNHTTTGGPGGGGGGNGSTNGGEIKQIVGTNELISTIPTIAINNANTIYSNANPYIIPMVECDVLVKEEQDGSGTTTSGIVSDGGKIYQKTTEGANIMLKKIESGNLTPVNTTVDMSAFSSRLISSEMIQQTQPSQITIYGGEFRDLIRVSEEQHQHQQQQTIIMPAGAVTSMAAAQCNVLTTNSYTIDHHQQQQQNQQQQCSTSTIIQQNNCTTTVAAAASAAVATSNNNFISTMTIPTFTTVKDRKRQLSTTTINCKKNDNDSISTDTTNEQHSIINHQNTPTTISSSASKKPKTFNHHKKKTVYSVVVPSSTCDTKINNRLNKKDCKNNNQSIQCGGGKRTSGGGNETIQQDIVVSSGGGDNVDNSDNTQKNIKDNNIYYHTPTSQQGYIR